MLTHLCVLRNGDYCFSPSRDMVGGIVSPTALPTYSKKEETT